MNSESSKTLLVIDPNQLQKFQEEINEKLDKILDAKKPSSSIGEIEWITSKTFMEHVSIKAFSSFYKILDRMPEAMKRKVGGKVYVHKDTIRYYFEGNYND